MPQEYEIRMICEESRALGDRLARTGATGHDDVRVEAVLTEGYGMVLHLEYQKTRLPPGSLGGARVDRLLATLRSALSALEEASGVPTLR